MDPATIILLGGGAAIAWLLTRQPGGGGGTGSGGGDRDEILGTVEDTLEWINTAVGDARKWVENDLQDAFGLPGEHTLKNFSGICHAIMQARLKEPEDTILKINHLFGWPGIETDDYRPNLSTFMYYLIKSNITDTGFSNAFLNRKFKDMCNPMINSQDEKFYNWSKFHSISRMKDFAAQLLHFTGENKWVLRNLAVQTDRMRKQYNLRAGMSPIEAFNTYPEYNAVYDYATNVFANMQTAFLTDDFVMHTGDSPNYYTDNPDRALEDFNSLEYFTSCPINHPPRDAQFYLHTLIPRHTYAYFRIARIMHGKVAYTVDKNFRELSLPEKKNVIAHLWFGNLNVVSRGFRQAIIAKGKPWKKD